MDASLISEFNPFPNGSYDATRLLLEKNRDVDAILAYNDDIAVSAMQACEDLGRKIPEDVAIIGFDDIPIASVIRPSLTTVRIGKQDLGKLAMSTLITMIDGEEQALKDQIITPTLVVRDSA
jgi:LacI family transcriptional regulator